MSALAAAAPPVPELRAPWSLRVAGGDEDVSLIHRWMGERHVLEYWQQHWSWGRWRREIDTQNAGEHSCPCLVARDGADLAYVEVYRVARDRLAGAYRHGAHDLGVHIAIGERRATGRGAGRALLGELARALLEAEGTCERVVAEPDAANAASIAAFTAAGFVASGHVRLPDKLATLMIRAR